MIGNDLGRDDRGRSDRIPPARPCAPYAGTKRARAPLSCREDRRRLLEELRVVAVHVGTAELLERRATVSSSPVLAALLQDRAARHRRAADRIRARVELAARG